MLKFQTCSKDVDRGWISVSCDGRMERKAYLDKFGSKKGGKKRQLRNGSIVIDLNCVIESVGSFSQKMCELNQHNYDPKC